MKSTVLQNDLTSSYCVAWLQLMICIYFYLEASFEFQPSKERTGLPRPTSTKSQVRTGWCQKARKPGHPEFNLTSQVSLMRFTVFKMSYLIVWMHPQIYSLQGMGGGQSAVRTAGVKRSVHTSRCDSFGRTFGHKDPAEAGQRNRNLPHPPGALLPMLW